MDSSPGGALFLRVVTTFVPMVAPQVTGPNTRHFFDVSRVNQRCGGTDCIPQSGHLEISWHKVGGSCSIVRGIMARQRECPLHHGPNTWVAMYRGGIWFMQLEHEPTMTPFPSSAMAPGDNNHCIATVPGVSMGNPGC